MKAEELQAFGFLLVITSVAIAQCCLQTNNGSGLPPFMDYGSVKQTERLLEHHQAIVTSYKFNCCGIITEWGVDVHRANEEYDLNFQVWRPSPTVKKSDGTGSYSLVESNRFSSISPMGGVVRVTLGSRSLISFQPGDVVGIYVEDTGGDGNGVVMTNSERELVWYASIGEYSTSSVYLVGSGGRLATSTHAAPVISIATSK